MFFQNLENGQSTVQNFYIWNRYNRMSGPTPMFILWLQLSARCHYLIDSTPDTMIQPFWRYISTSNNKCPSLLSLLPVPYYNCVSVPHLLTMSTMPNNIVYYSCLICESASRGLLRDPCYLPVPTSRIGVVGEHVPSSQSDDLPPFLISGTIEI